MPINEIISDGSSVTKGENVLCEENTDPHWAQLRATLSAPFSGDAAGMSPIFPRTEEAPHECPLGGGSPSERLRGGERLPPWMCPALPLGPGLWVEMSGSVASRGGLFRRARLRGRGTSMVGQNWSHDSCECGA